MEHPADTPGCSTGRPAWVLRLAAVEAADTVPLLLLLLLRNLLLLSIPHHMDGLLLLVLPLLLLPLLLLPGPACPWRVTSYWCHWYFPKH